MIRHPLTRLGLCFILYFSGIACYAADSSEMSFVAMSDIHFDPFILCEVHASSPCPLIKKLNAASSAEWPRILKEYAVVSSAYYRDTDYLLLSKSLTLAKQVAEKDQAEFIIVLGDFLGHDYRHLYRQYAQDKSRAHYQQFVRKTFEFLFAQLHDYFPHKNVFIVVGNNDSYRYDYYVEPNSRFFGDLEILGKRLLISPTYQDAFSKTFSSVGYYAVTLQPGLRLLVLNSVLFSNKVKGQQIDYAADQELSWLHQELVNAKKDHQRVLIAMHIPEGKDLYFLTSIKLFRIMDFWKQQYVNRFNTELSNFSEEIAGLLTGHLHWDSLHVLSLPKGNLDAIGVPAISPIFGTQPAFTLLYYSRPTYQLLDVDTYPVFFK